MRSLQNRLNELEMNSTPGEQIQIHRVIFDNVDQVNNRDHYKKVLVSEDDRRKIFELEKAK